MRARAVAHDLAPVCSASLPWSLDGPAAWGPAADPYRDMTNVSHQSQAFALETEMDRFLKFYPGGFLRASVSSGEGSRQKTSTITAITTTKRALKGPGESARKRCKKNDELARLFWGLNLDLRNGYLMGPMPAVSVLIPEAFRPINPLIPAVTLSNATSLAIYTPQHPQKGRASSS